MSEPKELDDNELLAMSGYHLYHTQSGWRVEIDCVRLSGESFVAERNVDTLDEALESIKKAVNSG